MEFRKDYILDRWAIISEKRGKRPKQYEEKHETRDEKTCFFCPGNEALTPREIGRVKDGKSWKMRWFPNKFPFSTDDADPKVVTDGKFFTHGGAYGYHEVIAETPEHDRQLWDLAKKDYEMLLDVYNMRIEELEKKENINYVAVFKNHGAKGGTSLVHSHTQVLASSHIPPLVRAETEAAKKFDACPFCKIADIESKSTRKCFENDVGVAFAPYASRFNYEVWIMPRKHYARLDELNKKEISGMAELIKKTLSKLKGIGASYNMFLHYAPEGEDLHFHIEITPRIATWAGFEFLTDITINSVAPESAAKFYREED